MYFLFYSVFLIGFAIGKPTSSELSHQIIAVFGDEFDVTDYEKIFEEEALKLNVSAAKHFQTCKTGIAELFPTAEENEEMKEDKWQVGWINSTDEILPYLSKHAPRTHDFLDKRVQIFKRRIEKLDNLALNFAEEVGNRLAQFAVLYSHASSSGAGKEDAETKVIGWMADIVVKFEKLPQSSKNNIEMTFCAQSLVRMALTNERFQVMAKPVIEQYQKIQ